MWRTHSSSLVIRQNNDLPLNQLDELDIEFFDGLCALRPLRPDEIFARSLTIQ
jgi:hypothetical protein